MWKPFSKNEITAVFSVILFIIGAMAVGVILFPPKPDPKLYDYFREPIAMADLERMLELVYNIDNGLPGRAPRASQHGRNATPRPSSKPTPTSQARFLASLGRSNFGAPDVRPT